VVAGIGVGAAIEQGLQDAQIPVRGRLGDGTPTAVAGRVRVRSGREEQADDVLVASRHRGVQGGDRHGVGRGETDSRSASEEAADDLLVAEIAGERERGESVGRVGVEEPRLLPEDLPDALALSHRARLEEIDRRAAREEHPRDASLPVVRREQERRLAVLRTRAEERGIVVEGSRGRGLVAGLDRSEEIRGAAHFAAISGRGRLRYFSYSCLCLLSRLISRPSIHARRTCVRISRGSPSAAKSVASFPTSIEPTRSATPRIRAGSSVTLRRAASLGRPKEAAIPAWYGRMRTLK